MTQDAHFLGSDIPYSSCTACWSTCDAICKVDGDYLHGNGRIDINGHNYEKGIVQHANGKAYFILGRMYSNFSVCIGISKTSKNPKCGVTIGDARFRVSGDNVVLRDWEVKGSPGDPTCFEIDVLDVDVLVLEVDNNGTRNCDFSTWADAKIIKSNKVSYPKFN